MNKTTVTIELTDRQVTWAKTMADREDQQVTWAKTMADRKDRDLPYKAIVAALPEPIEVGDEVLVEALLGRCVVLAVDGSRAWVRDQSGYRYDLALTSLTKVVDQ